MGLIAGSPALSLCGTEPRTQPRLGQATLRGPDRCRITLPKPSQPAVCLNTIQLTRYGRYRSTLWTYPGCNTFRKGRMEDLGGHPTVKPIALVSDLIKDSSHRGDAVLDAFCGSGTTLLATERTGRIGYGIEVDPVYVDLAVRRWEKMTGERAVHAETGLPFADLADVRSSQAISESATQGPASAASDPSVTESPPAMPNVRHRVRRAA
jgi:hypothetical protein